jgi:hypothetical protein
MSAWTQLYSLARSIIKRPVAWLGGIVVAGLAAATTDNVKDFFKSAEISISEKVGDLSCRYRQKPIASESQFTILVSPLKYDPDGSHTEKVKSAFHGEKGFLVVPICESVAFDYSRDMQTTEDETLQAAKDLIKTRHADLLLFGEVRERDKAVKIWAVNESGGCDRHPKPTIIEHGDLPDDFNAEEKENLIAVSLQEIQSACRNQSSINWELFAKRMIKMENILNDFTLYKDKYSNIYIHYKNAMRFLYSNGQGDVWFAAAEATLMKKRATWTERLRITTTP